VLRQSLPRQENGSTTGLLGIAANFYFFAALNGLVPPKMFDD
jgi:hypothetical protein